MATDDAALPEVKRATSVRVRVMVMDANDNAPQFVGYKRLREYDDQSETDNMHRLGAKIIGANQNFG